MDGPIFRANFPEFGDTTTYPDSMVNMWLGVAVNMLKTSVWGNMLDVGLQLFTAHHVAIAGQNLKTANVGGMPGGNRGPVASKGVDKVNISYDTASVIEEGAGHWNLTTYGTQFINMVKLIGAGGAQVGGCGFGPVPPGFVPFPWSPQ